MASIIQPVGNFTIIFCSAAMKISAEIKSGSRIEDLLNTGNGDSVYPITFH